MSTSESPQAPQAEYTVQRINDSVLVVWGGRYYLQFPTLLAAKRLAEALLLVVDGSDVLDTDLRALQDQPGSGEPS